MYAENGGEERRRKDRFSVDGFADAALMMEYRPTQRSVPVYSRGIYIFKRARGNFVSAADRNAFEYTECDGNVFPGIPPA